MKRRIIVAGGSGLVGRQVLAELAGEKQVELHALFRAESDNAIPGVVSHVAAPDQWAAIVAAHKPDILISCLGSTMKAAGSKANFRKVDYDLVVALARAARSVGTRQCIAVSSVGASAKSSNFYLKTKGEAEEAVRALDFERIDFLHPGLLTGGKRKDSRTGEALAILLSPLSDMLMLGPLSQYRSTPSAQVAKAIVTLALGGGYGKYIHRNYAITALAG